MAATQLEYKQSCRGERIKLGIVILCAIILYAPTLKFFWDKWMEDTQYSLAYLVPFVSGYFIWKKWPEVKSTKRSSSALGLWLIITAVMLHLVGTVLDISGPSSISVFVCALGICLYFHSKQIIRVLAFPAAYTLFMMPVPGGILDMVGFPLQLWASGATAALLRAAGIDVVRNGVNMSVPGFDFQVAAACSGMSSLVALVGVTAVFAYITRLPIKYKWLLFCLSLPIALAANVVRITTIALVGYQWGPDAATNIYHDWSSPLLFVAAIILLFIINGGLEWIVKRRTTS